MKTSDVISQGIENKRNWIHTAIHQIKPHGERKPSVFCFSCRDFLAPKTNELSLAKAIQTKHVITFGLVAIAIKGAPVSYCLAMVKHQTVEYSVSV
jgi:hypothetical protein